MLNVVTVVVAFFCTNVFLLGRWTWYGLEVFAYYQLPPEEQRMSARTNPMCYVFPRVAACDYYRSVNAACSICLIYPLI